MRVLYGIVGTGMGHATRSTVVIDHLVSRGHTVLVAVSEGAFGFLSSRYAASPVDVVEIAGFVTEYGDGAVSVSRTLWANLRQGLGRLGANLRVERGVLDAFDPHVVISDFETWTWHYAKRRGVPVISLDNQGALGRCDHPADILPLHLDAQLTRAACRWKVPGAYHYLVTSFFAPNVRRRRTTVVPPILRPAVLDAHRERGEHVLVYLSGSDHDLVGTLAALPVEVRVYGMGARETEGNVVFRSFSEEGFVDDLRTARALVAGAGFSLMCEALHLGVPMLAIPLGRQFEQVMNARYLEELGYGAVATEPTLDAVLAFLDRTDDLERALEAYERSGNGMLLAALDELIDGIRLGEPAPTVLDAPSVASWGLALAA